MIFLYQSQESRVRWGKIGIDYKKLKWVKDFRNLEMEKIYTVNHYPRFLHK